jgi:hypothetical protein
MDRWIGSSLRDLCVLRDCRRKRASSWDRTGGNADCVRKTPRGKTVVLADIKGAGIISHIWITISCPGDRMHLRKIVLRMYWDGEKNPSVEAPVGDFFGIGHGMTKNFWSAPLAMSPQGGRALNCFFPMPFAKGARVELKNECDSEIGAIYYYIDYEEYPALPENLGRFHAWWNRENPTKAIPLGKLSWRKPNLTGKENYLILDAKGKGHYVGCTMNVDSEKRGWYGEGDDMIFIDGEKWPPSLHGTGTEDYFNTAWCPNEEYTSPYHGLPLVQNPDYSGKTTLYRFHIEDPVMFDESIRVTIEHGHANDHSHDCSSVAYWYQAEPHRKFPKFPSVKARVPWP